MKTKSKIKELSTQVLPKEKKVEVKTSRDELDKLKTERDSAVSKYNKYLKLYNKQHDIEGRNLIKEIISLHIKGIDNKSIIDKGYNKWTVNEQIRLFKKGKRVTKTVIAKFLPPKEKK